jgi:alpha-ribazole phosphatase
MVYVIICRDVKATVKPMPLFAMRHGRTNFNDLGLCNDDPGRDVSLTETGIQQIESAAIRLCEIPLQRIIVSELPRTRQSANIINHYHQVPITTHPALNDIRSGFDGKPVADYFAAISEDPLHTRPPGGESLLDHKQRIGGFIDWLRTQPEHTILLVVHEETLRALTAQLNGLDDQKMIELHFDNGQIVEFNW